LPVSRRDYVSAVNDDLRAEAAANLAGVLGLPTHPEAIPMIDQVRAFLKKHGDSSYRAGPLATAMGIDDSNALHAVLHQLKTNGEVVTCVVQRVGQPDELEYRISAGRGASYIQGILKTAPVHPVITPGAPLRIPNFTPKPKTPRGTQSGEPSMTTGTRKQVVAAITKANHPLDTAAVVKATGLTTKQASAALSNAKRDKSLIRIGGRLWGLPGMNAIAEDPLAAAMAGKKKKCAPYIAAPKRKAPAMAKRAAKQKYVIPAKAGIQPAHKPAANGGTNGARFGFFSDGSLMIECEGCKGILTQSDMKAMNEFTAKFEGQLA
jgi:hypothetical protein